MKGGKKPPEEELDDQLEESDEDDEGSSDTTQDELEEAEIDAQVKEMVQEFLAIPEVKGLVGEIARDAAKRASDGVRNEAYNKVQKSFEQQFKTLGERLVAIEQAAGVQHVEDSGTPAESSGEPDTVRRRMLELDRRAKELEDRERDIAEQAAESQKASLDSYRRAVVAEYGLSKVAHLVHGENEDEIDDSVVEARKTLNGMRRDFIKELKDKGWNPPAEELGDEDSSAASASVEGAGDLRKRFNYGPQSAAPLGTTVPQR
jgi:hypothetical protein